MCVCVQTCCLCTLHVRCGCPLQEIQELRAEIARLEVDHERKQEQLLADLNKLRQSLDHKEAQLQKSSDKLHSKSGAGELLSYPVADVYI